MNYLQLEHYLLKKFCPKHEAACSVGYTNEQGGAAEGVGISCWGMVGCFTVKPQPPRAQHVYGQRRKQ